ncbi:MAG TPA: hypothetical protein PKM73_08475 [Verrucomicrobiota bacterium]|nr:hypothetical protein [Verrucomicrobiota bacterium]HNU51849.1 hypothetical protein [Verrucomicrobiota bacterium]
MKRTQSNLIRGALASLVIIALGMAGAYEAKGGKPPKPVDGPAYLVRADFADTTADEDVNILADGISYNGWDYWDYRDSECPAEYAVGKSDLDTGGRWLFSTAFEGDLGRNLGRGVVLNWEPLDPKSPDPDLEAELGYPESGGFGDAVGVWIDADVFKDTVRDAVVFKFWEGPYGDEAGRNWQLSYLEPLYVVRVDADTAVLTTQNPLTGEHDVAAAELINSSGKGKPVVVGTYWMPMTITVYRTAP